MALDTTVPRSRRALLGAAIGAAVATVASALGRPAPVQANDPNDVVLGQLNQAGRTTIVDCGQVTAFEGSSSQGYGLYGHSASEVGVMGLSGSAAGVKGLSSTADGVVGSSTGDSKSGVYGFNSNQLGYGVFGRNTYNNAAGFLGGFSAGVKGLHDTKYGVHGGSPSGDGVYGESVSACGVKGRSGTGIGGYFESVDAAGTALSVVGKAKFSRSGKVLMAKGRYYVDVIPKGGLTGTPLCFATLMTYRAGFSVAAVRPNWPSTGRVRIYLNKALASSTYIAWIVIG